ncbi:MAG: peptidyl-prolyl cis-trans isomerase [Acidobacteriota bacterium]|nr:peptidyl-prolyl cis-trans isomerase [Acidobacteriota bacterium]
MNGRRLKITCAVLSLSLMLVVLMAGCGSKTATNSSNSNQSANVKKGIKPEPDAEVAVIEMENPAYGKIVVELYPNIAPKMVERFKQLIKEGFYNGTTFHRIDPQLGIIQGGDPLSKDDNPANDGTGDSPYPNVPGEFSDVPYERGIFGAARKGANPEFGMSEEEARDTGNCQYFITLKRVPPFDGNYTVFGRVIEGMSNADVIAGAPTETSNPTRPAEKIVVKSITLQPRKQ